MGLDHKKPVCLDLLHHGALSLLWIFVRYFHYYFQKINQQEWSELYNETPYRVLFT
jgi:hypothetical protein